MCDCRFQPLLARYHDRELPKEAALDVEEHLGECAACAAELAGLRGLSARIAEGMNRAAGAEEEVMALLHDAVERAAEEERASVSLLRTARALSALAASVLVVGTVWLVDTRGDDGAGGAGDVAGANGPVAMASDWERVAMTLRAEPRPGVAADSPFPPRYGEAIAWMLDGLLPGAGLRPTEVQAPADLRTQ